MTDYDALKADLRGYYVWRAPVHIVVRGSTSSCTGNLLSCDVQPNHRIGRWIGFSFHHPVASRPVTT